jgi:phosphomannomutase
VKENIMTKPEKSIESICHEYLLEEPDQIYREQITSLLEEKATEKELYDRMLRHLNFGTAGLRGRMEAGYNRMNLGSVYLFCYALGQDLLEQEQSRVMVAFDIRDNSEIFAHDAVKILGALGLDVYAFSEYIATPVAAFATKFVGADAGIMITASHNPKCDNGIKLFSGSSAQASGEVIRRIEKGMADAPLRFAFFSKYDESIRCVQSKILGREIFSHYEQSISSTRFFSNDEVNRSVNVVYTPLHGVGKKFFLPALMNEGFINVTVVPNQSEPDGQFPTVVFPNPEEHHTLDQAHQFALNKNCSWVFANDPDADRLQISCKDFFGQFRKLSGNEMGAILAYFSLLKAKSLGVKPLVASSIVSSRMLKSMSKQFDAIYVDALTGFSNIVAKAIEKQEQSEHRLIFAYEEALGFLIGQEVLDKDGIHAGVRFMEIAGYLEKRAMTIWQLLDDLYFSFGIFANHQWSQRFDGSAAMGVMQNFMTNVRSVDAREVAKIFDGKKCEKFDLLKSQNGDEYIGINGDVVIFEIINLFRLLIRPSGTEPKIKFYMELMDKPSNRQNVSSQKSKLEETLIALKYKIELIFQHKT